MTGTRAKPWLPAASHAERDWHKLAMQHRADPGFVDTLRAAVDAHPRLARAYLITAALAVVAALALLGA